MRIAQTVFFTSIMLMISGCRDNGEPSAANPFGDLGAVEVFDSRDVDFYVNGEMVWNDDVVLYIDTVPAAAETRQGTIRLHMIEYTPRYVTVDVLAEPDGDSSYRIYGTKETDGRSRYEVDCVLERITAPYTNAVTSHITVNLTYTVLSQYAGNTYEADYGDSPFDFKFFDGGSTEINGQKVDNYTIQKRISDLLNSDAAQRGTKVKYGLSKDGILTVYTADRESDEYEQRFAVRYWWDDDSDHCFYTDLWDVREEFLDVFISRIPYNDVDSKVLSHPLFYNAVEFDIFGTPLPGYITPNIEITAAGRAHASLLSEIWLYRTYDDTWAAADAAYLREAASIVYNNKNADIPMYPGWTLKCITKEFGNWGN